jgi:small GTP-binding protein
LFNHFYSVIRGHTIKIMKHQSKKESKGSVTGNPRKKLVIVGDGACGKTCLLIMFSKGTFPEVYVPTVFENYVAEVDLDGRTVELALWDTAGQEDYDRLRPLSYPEADVILICFSVDTPGSFGNVIEKWVPEVLHYCHKTPFILVGCKVDLRDQQRDDSNSITTGQFITKELSKRIVSKEDGQNMAARIGAYSYVECSAKTGFDVRKVFETATRAACNSDTDSTKTLSKSHTSKAVASNLRTSTLSKKSKCIIH